MPIHHWTASRKYGVLCSLDAGSLTEARILELYEISSEELAEWRRQFAKHGLKGLTATKRFLRRPRSPDRPPDLTR